MTTATRIPPAPTWDLDSIFPGGSASEKYSEFRRKVKRDLESARTMMDSLPQTLDGDSQQAWTDVILLLEKLIENLDLEASFAGCLISQNVDDQKAASIRAEAEDHYAVWQKLTTELEALAMKQSDEAWKSLVSGEQLSPRRYYLDRMRQLASRKMSVEKESLALDLAVNGYHAWNRLYDKMAGDLRVDFEEDTISLGQLATRLSDSNRDVRRVAFEKLTEAWESRADLAAMTLNALGGFRLSLYRNRGWDNVLFEPLWIARLEERTLTAMWRVVSQEKNRLQPYIDAKKRLLGIDRYMWYDEFAPVGKVDTLYPFDEAGDFIVKHTRDFSEHMSEFCRLALDRRWVEAEDRPGKAGGGFCTGMGPFRESRIFMTYAGTYENLLTLAHELGHAYHGYVLKKAPFFATDYPMTLAETASIFSESLVTDAALAECSDPQEKLMLLDQKIQQAYIMFCDIHSRFLFEQAFYRERRDGYVSRDRLSELMIEAQREAFGGMLDESGFHPLFWCSKLHFYISGVPFYNFPYAFGYLFAGGVYDRARKEGSSFADKYRALLADTGSMSTEDVAKRHLDVDLGSEEFWVDAVTRSVADVDEFVKLAKNAR